ncbi:hypothetical protein J1N35_007932 [Gossypium stocksii]|uniref:Uncharacterized protein n=1 Tax=Gossypium stocksii TaxID=47602 RepID=A0A9D4AFP4_9ROSI|nr:hypothetical protein J1N35_007932 [Gossypium stocksii]
MALPDYGVDKYDIGTAFGHFGIGVENVGGCGFFKWYDDKLCYKENEVICELYDSERKLSKENTRLRKQIMKCGSGETFESGNRNYNVEISMSDSVQNVGKDNQTKEREGTFDYFGSRKKIIPRKLGAQFFESRK